MTGPELSAALQTLGLDTQAAAQWLGVSVRAVQRYRVSGAPGPVAGMVRLALRIEDREARYMPRVHERSGWVYMEPVFGGRWIDRLALDWRE